MATPAGILNDFAAVLLLLRDHPEKKEELKHAFHRFVAGFNGEIVVAEAREDPRQYRFYRRAPFETGPAHPALTEGGLQIPKPAGHRA